MTQKAGKGKQGGGKVIAQSHNVAKGGFQKSKAGAMQSKQAFIGKKDVKPIGKAGPQGGKGQKPAGKIAIGGKGMNAKKGKIEEDDDDDEDEDDEDDFDGESMDDEEMDDDDIDDDDDDDDGDDDEDDEELSDDENDVKPSKDAKQGKAALTPKSILKNGSTPKSAADAKAPKLVTAANGATPKGNQAQAKAQNQKAAADTKVAPAAAKVQAKERQRTASGSDDAFKLIANTEAEALTATLRSDFDTRVKRIAGNTVFVKGLHRRCSEDDLRRLAKDVLTIRLPLHENKGAKAGAGGRIRGYAFLEFKDEATARKNAEFLKKDAQLVNSEGQPCKLEASISSAGGYVMTADDWNVGSLYVSNLPNSVTENDVLALFDRTEVVTVVLPRNRTTGVPRGVAHVRFRSAEASIRQFDAARAKVLRGEFSIKGHSLSIAFSSRKTLKRERAEQGNNAKAAKPAATNSQTKVAEVKPSTPSQTPKPAAGQKNAGSAAKATPTTANQKGNVAANKSLNESVTMKNAANLSLTKKPETPASAQKGAIKRKLGEEEAKRKAKVAKRDEEEDDDDDEDDDDVDDDDEDDDDDE